MGNENTLSGKYHVCDYPTMSWKDKCYIWEKISSVIIKCGHPHERPLEEEGNRGYKSIALDMPVTVLMILLVQRHGRQLEGSGRMRQGCPASSLPFLKHRYTGHIIWDLRASFATYVKGFKRSVSGNRQHWRSSFPWPPKSDCLSFTEDVNSDVFVGKLASVFPPGALGMQELLPKCALPCLLGSKRKSQISFHCWKGGYSRNVAARKTVWTSVHRSKRDLWPLLQSHTGSLWQQTSNNSTGFGSWNLPIVSLESADAAGTSRASCLSRAPSLISLKPVSKSFLPPCSETFGGFRLRLRPAFTLT